MTMGQMLIQWLTKLDWFSTLFPRIPVPIQKQIESKLNNYYRMNNINVSNANNQCTSQSVQSEPERRQERSAPDRSRERDSVPERRSDRSERDRFDRPESKRTYRSRSRSREKHRR